MFLLLGCFQTGEFGGGDEWELGDDYSDASDSAGPESDTAGAGCVSGTVVTTEGEPIAGVTVTAWDVEACETLAFAISGDDGAFCLDDVPVGAEVEVVAEVTGECEGAFATRAIAADAGTCDDGGCTELGAWAPCADAVAAVCP
ncbi:MAG: carboxypeptidase-like regulatory domain-containing protein [Myxococcota bacterium]